MKKLKLKRPAKQVLVGLHLDPLGEIHFPDFNVVMESSRCGHSIGISYYNPNEVKHIIDTYLADGLCPPCYRTKHGKDKVDWAFADSSDHCAGDSLIYYYPVPGQV